jgi:cyclophilin family peptidyl-prolyl cis-trans isomerase
MRPLLITALLLTPSLWAQAAAASDTGNVEAVVTTDMGVFRFEFAPEKAPKHVARFLAWARQGYYNGSAFFRVVANGIVQGGDPLLKNPATPRKLWGTGGLSLQPSEFSDLKHERGTVSTVSVPGKADSDGAQFFICVSPQPSLDGHYSAFGRVTEGMDVVERISQIAAGAGQIADKPVRIQSIAIEPKRVEPFANASVEEMRRVVILKTTLGSLKIRMEPEWAPENVRNFLGLVASGFYNATAFHRLVKGFVVQGGMGNTRASGPQPADRWVHPVKGEFRPDLKHDRGIVSIARGDDPDSATSSFFLVLGPAPHLDGKYSIIGRVVEGMDVLDAFEKEEVDGETPKRRLELIDASVEGNG